MSRFVSGGTSDAPTARSAEWLKAQSAIESAQAAKAALSQPETKSLYDTLQANKAAKQEAFEESAKLKHQFRTLDEDEVDFLESLTKGERDAEAARRRETAEGLAAFREAREKVEQEGSTEDVLARDEGSWEAGRKRKKERKGLVGVKARKVEDGEAKTLPKDEPKAEIKTAIKEASKDIDAKATPAQPPAKPAPKTGSLGLADYGSDSDD